MRLIPASFVPLFLSILAVGCSNEKNSNVDATDEANGKKVGHWYETFDIDPNGEKSFVKFHQDNKDLLLGNRHDVLPDTLKGLWFMNGNPVGDQTLNLHRVRPAENDKEDFSWEVNEPMTFSWLNIANSHEKVSKIGWTKLRYSFKFLDCPEDVKLERQERWGMSDGSCTRDDKQFAIITPVVSSFLGEIRVPQSVAYFDMYLRPKSGDFNIWERRSKVFKVSDIFVKLLTEAVRKETEQNRFHRYLFTQILDKDGVQLSSYSLFTDHVRKLISENSKEEIFYLCEKGVSGCEREAIIKDDLVQTEDADVIDFGAIPAF